MEFLIDGVAVKTDISDITEKEAEQYVKIVKLKNYDSQVKARTITDTKDGNIDLCVDLQPVKFERIRRITGYLVGTIDRWNNAKRQEEHDRVKHE